MGDYPDMTQGPEESGDQDASRVQVSGSSGVQVGSGNVQYNFFGDRAAPRRSADAPATRPSGPAPSESDSEGHAFISYVHEDAAEVDWLQQVLESAGIPVWRDTDNLRPGETWRVKIREAIADDALAFIACFSRRGVARPKSYQYQELWLAVDELRSRRPGVSWLIPVRFDDCDIPGFDLGSGPTLSSIQRIDLFGANRDQAASRLVAAVKRLLP